MNKKLKISIAIIGIVLIGFAIMQSKWKIYSDTTYGLQFEIPSDWKEEKTANGERFYSPDLLLVAGQSGVDELQKGVEFQFQITTAPTENVYELNLKNPPSETINIDGAAGFLHQVGRWGAYMQSTGKTIDIIRGTRAYRFIISYTEDNEKAGAAYFDKIISTIKFSTTDNSDWTTYKDQELKLGFEIQYPNDWKVTVDPGVYETLGRPSVYFYKPTAAVFVFSSVQC
jgi:hypothetical protein